jgi:hypothetical protein
MTSGQKGNALPLDTGVKSHQKIAIFTANQQRNTELKNKQSNPNVKIHSTSFIGTVISQKNVQQNVHVQE